jgi:hypothetical protein
MSAPFCFEAHMGSILPTAETQFLNNIGFPLVGGKVYFYQPGTENPATTWQDSALTIPNTNPVVLDSAGRAIIWGNTTYRQVVKDRFGITIWDQIVSAGVALSDLSGTGGAGLIGMADGTTLATQFLNKINLVLNSFGALRAVSKAAYTRATLTGGTAAGDGGGDDFYLDPNDMSSADDGWTTIVATDGGRWKRIGLRYFRNMSTPGVIGYALLKRGIANGDEPGWTSNPSNTGTDWVTDYSYISSSSGRNRIWAVNACTDVTPGNDATAWAVEANVNNTESNVADPGAVLKKVIFDAVSGGSAPVTAGYRASAGVGDGSNWLNVGYYADRCLLYGAWFRQGGGDTGVGFSGATIWDQTDSPVILLANGNSHHYGIDFNGASFTAAPIRLPNNSAVVARNAANNADVSLLALDINNNLVLGQGSSGSEVSAASLIPISDNIYSLGTSGARWTSVWAANGTIQTSDATQKTNIAPIVHGLSVVNALTPKTFQWKVGGYDQQDVQETQLVQDELVEQIDEDYVDTSSGVPVQKTRTVEKRTPILDRVPVTDESGKPVMVPVIVRGKQVGETQMLHSVPRMVQKTVTVTKPIARAGRRMHSGFLANEVKAAFDAVGIDFGGYVLGEDGLEGIRPDQLIPVLWKAVQELSAQVEALQNPPSATV